MEVLNGAQSYLTPSVTDASDVNRRKQMIQKFVHRIAQNFYIKERDASRYSLRPVHKPDLNAMVN